MNTISRLALCALLTCSAFAISAKEELTTSKPTATRYEHYVSAEKGYSLDYPADWKKSDIPQLDLILFAPSKQTSGYPHASMNVVSEKVGNDVTLDQFYKESAANLAASLKEVNVQKTGAANLNGIPSKWMLYTHNMQGVQFRVIQYFVVAKGSIYLITFSAAADAFDGYRPTFEEIIRSFKLSA